MDQKATNDGTLKTYRAWQRYILKAKPKLTKGCTAQTLKLYCLAMAFHGRNGIGCYTSDAVIADEMCMYDARSVRPYRHEALRLGWFVWTGKTIGRSQVLDIAIPADEVGIDTNLSVPTTPVGNDEPKCNCIGCWQGTGCIMDDEPVD